MKKTHKKFGKSSYPFLTEIKNFVLYYKKFKNNENLQKNEELTGYVNKIFEQQEKEKIVRWLVNSIRESLDLDKMFETIVEEIGKLLKVDRCLTALFEKKDGNFYFRNEYRKNEAVVSMSDNEKTVCEIPNAWHNMLVKRFFSVVINDCSKDTLNIKQKEYLENNDIKSLIIIPIVHKEEILGIIMVHQIEFQRNWEEDHLEILKDIGSQTAIAVRQAILYSKVQEATRLKSEFLAGMSHELKTPLNAVIGFSEMLISEDYGKLNIKQKKFLNNISVSGEHLLKLVNDILDPSKIESGNMQIYCETFNIYHAVEETVSVLKSLAMKKNIDLKMNVSRNIFINADLRRFKQVMYNLLSNAVKFTEDKGKIRVKAYQDGSNLKVEIHDTGIGIAAKDKDKIFKNFRQLDSSLTRKQEGTGLGLTLTKKLVELHNGEIDFESKEGKGSKFWFSLPGLKVE